MNYGKLNDLNYFYFDNVTKMLIEFDLNILFNNFNQPQQTFDLIRYLKLDNTFFDKRDPKNHYNLILNLKDQRLNYYYSFPFSHNQLYLYDYLSNKDWNDNNKNQYWRPYIGVHDKNLVNLTKIKIGINLNNFIINNNLHFKSYKILKMYTNR